MLNRAIPQNALLVLSGMLLLAACGQKGPLYLPGNPSEMQTEVPAQSAPSNSAPANNEQKDEDDDEDYQLDSPAE